MKNIAFFCIPAHGHTNPMLPVAKELTDRGHHVRFYSFDEFGEKIKATGAEFISCDSYLPEISKKEEENLKKVSTTEMTIQDIKVTIAMNDFLNNEFETFKPDVVYTDSVCFWGKLNAWKFNVPMVVSTSTFAFNQMSSQYMKHSPSEMAGLIFGLPKISKALKTLEPYGFHVKNPLALVQSDDKTDSIVYATKKYQPYSNTFSDHYCFIGPSVFSKEEPSKEKDRPLIYISMGTVINDRPDLYSNCVEALKDLNVDVIISCGKTFDIESLGTLPSNIKIYPSVNQLEILAKADAFISHCGMNSASESLYMATPIILYPQTGEQEAVARRVYEMGAGTYLKEDSIERIRTCVKEIIENKEFAKCAKECSDDFRTAGGVKAAADFIENAPHEAEPNMILVKMSIKSGIFNLLYWVVAIALMIVLGNIYGSKYIWILGIFAGIVSGPIGKMVQKRIYRKLCE